MGLHHINFIQNGGMVSPAAHLIQQEKFSSILNLICLDFGNESKTQCVANAHPTLHRLLLIVI